MELCLCDNIELHDYSFPSDDRQIQTLSKNLDRAPWEDKLQCAFTTNAMKMHTVWPNLRLISQCNLVALVSDFYLYEHMIHMSGFNKIPADIVKEFLENDLAPGSICAMGQEASLRQESLVKIWTPVLKEYLHSAVISELCHHVRLSDSFNTDDARCAMWGWGVLGKRVGREGLARYAHILFSTPWKKYFGGAKWRSVCDLLIWSESGRIENQPFTDHLFFDRVFSLQHNTDSIFDKEENWCITNWCTSKDYLENPHHLLWLKTVLNAHHNGDVLILNEHASPVAQALYSQFTLEGP